MKLTNAMKERIIKSIMTDTFVVRENMISIEKTKLADRIYTDFYGLYLKDMSRLPEEFFIQKSDLSLRFGSDSRYATLAMNTTRRVGKLHDYSNWNFSETHAFTVTYRSIEAKSLTLSRDKDKLMATLRSIIIPITTDKRLIEVWPDAEKWIPTTPAAMSNLPVVQVDGLNDMIIIMKGEEVNK